MKIKWNWGTGIFLTILVMLGFLAFLVNKTFEYKINKVSDDYYEKGLNHTQQMNRVENTRLFSKEFDVIHTDVCTVHFPEFFKNKTINGEVLFFRPSDYSKDLSFPISLDTNCNQVFSLDNFYKGKYIVKATFDTDSIPYYLEKEIIF